MLEKVYNAVRQFIFSNIYPAPWIFNRSTRSFIGLRQLSRLLPDYAELCHNLSFDLHGNMHEAIDHESLHPGRFEAVLIAKLDKKNIYANEKQYLIIVGGNTTCYQIFIPEMIGLYKKHHKQAYVLGFNPPGVGMSPGATNTPEDFCNALKSIIDNLCNNGVPADNIFIIAHSLGAAIAARTLVQFHENGKPVRLFTDRTMMRISEIAAVKMQKLFPIRILRYTLGLLIYWLMKLLIKLVNLELDVAKDFVRINTISPGAARGMLASHDEVIDDCDLYYGLPEMHQLEYYRKFKLKMDDKHKKSHSKPRHELIEENGEKSAEQYLDECIKLKM